VRLKNHLLSQEEPSKSSGRFDPASRLSSLKIFQQLRFSKPPFKPSKSSSSFDSASRLSSLQNLPAASIQQAASSSLQNLPAASIQQAATLSDNRFKLINVSVFCFLKFSRFSASFRTFPVQEYFPAHRHCSFSCSACDALRFPLSCCRIFNTGFATPSSRYQFPFKLLNPFNAFKRRLFSIFWFDSVSNPRKFQSIFASCLLNWHACSTACSATSRAGCRRPRFPHQSGSEFDVSMVP
jgi:hypothetical protein